MKSNKHDVAIGRNWAATITNEASLIDLLQRSRRPVADVSFRPSTKVWSKTASLQLGGTKIVATAGSPMHFETYETPQYSLVLPIYGTGRVTERGRELAFGGNQIIRCSFKNRISIDYDDYSGLSIHPNIDDLMNVLHIEPRHRDYVQQRLREASTCAIENSNGDINYYEAFCSVVNMIAAADENEDYLERVGIEGMLIKLIAELTLALDPELSTYTRRVA